jgi:hypothetical protein
MCHRHHIGRWRRLQLIDEIHDSRQFVSDVIDLLRRDFKPRKHSNMLYLLFRQ